MSSVTDNRVLLDLPFVDQPLIDLLKLFIRGSSPLHLNDKQNLDTLQLIESLVLTKECLVDQLQTQVIPLTKGREVTVVPGTEYKKDKNHLYFWHRSRLAVEDLISTDMAHVVKLSTGEKRSLNPSISKFLVLFMDELFRNLSVLKPTCAYDSIVDGKAFDAIIDYVETADLGDHEEDTIVSRAVIKSRASTISKSIKESKKRQQRSRLKRIKNIM